MIDILIDNSVQKLDFQRTGYNNVNIATARGLKVVRVPAYSPYAVAKHTIALMLSLNQKTPRVAWCAQHGNFSLNRLLDFDMYGKKAGNIGTGKIPPGC